MGQCCSTSNGKDRTEHDHNRSVEQINEEDRCEHVRELAVVVVRCFQQSLNEFEKHTEYKDAEKFEYDIVPWMDEIVERLQYEFNPLMDRIRYYIDEEKTDKTFLIPRNKIAELGLTAFPKHEDAIKIGLLKEVEIDDMRIKLCREFNRGIHTHFISHKWCGNTPDTHDNVIFQNTKDAAHYIWFDYTCVPQDDHHLRLRHLLAIANICSEATVVRMHGNEELEKAYNSSVWCQLEAALLQWDDVYFDHKMEWTIYDWNDLYAVLPGFLDVWVNSPKNHHFFARKEGYARTSMVVSMLKAFIAYHDSKHIK